MQEENGAYQDQMNTIISDYVNINQTKKTHFVKSVQIQSFFCPYISVFSPNAGNYGPEKKCVFEQLSRSDNYTKISIKYNP